MAENELTITLKAVDEASEPIKTALTGIKLGADDVKKSTDQAGKTIQQQFREAGKEVHEFRKTLFLATAALGVIITTTQSASKYNKEAKETYDKFTTSITALTATIGSALGPALNGVTAVVNFLRDAIEAAVAGFIKLFSLIIESFTALGEGMKNIADNIKNIFTGKEDPMGIVEGFRVSFEKALKIADDASQQFLNGIEKTRAAVEGGQTLEGQAKQKENEDERAKKSAQDRAKVESDLKKKAFLDTKQLLADIGKENKAAAVLAQVIAITESIVNTSVAITKALPNIPLAIAVGAIGAAQTALIASQSFAVGTPSVPYDMTAQIHKGETIIPATFAESIRRGELSLSGSSGPGGVGDIQINLYGVSINSKENIRELAEELGFEIDKNLRNARSRI